MEDEYVQPSQTAISKYQKYRLRKKLKGENRDERIKELALEQRLKQWRVWGLKEYRNREMA